MKFILKSANKLLYQVYAILFAFQVSHNTCIKHFFNKGPGTMAGLIDGL